MTQYQILLKGSGSDAEIAQAMRDLAGRVEGMQERKLKRWNYQEDGGLYLEIKVVTAKPATHEKG